MSKEYDTMRIADELKKIRVLLEEWVQHYRDFLEREGIDFLDT